MGSIGPNGADGKRQGYESRAVSTVATTWSGAIESMQRKSIGHSRRKQGEQGALEVSRWCLESPGRPGPVNAGEVLPKGTTTDVPSAAATCIGPESLVRTRRESLRVDMRSRRFPLPALFTMRVLARPITSAQRAASFGPPIAIQTAFGIRSQTWRATAANRSAGQRLAGP